MKAYVGVTDGDWFEFLRGRPDIDEVNFWQPGGGRRFRALQPGQPFLFKLHYPANRIVGGGFFTHFSRLPVSLAWNAFREKNGSGSFTEMRRRIEKYRRISPMPHEDYEIGCIVLEEPFFLPRANQIAAPEDWPANVVSGKTYALDEGAGKRLWEEVLAARAVAQHLGREGPQDSIYGDPKLIRPRLGQGGFRVLVTDVYKRHCAVSGEGTLPVLEAAHIRPVSEGGQHRVDNGLLMRSDIHTLFDLGYVTVTPKYEFRVSPRVREEWHNGRIYYGLEGTRIALPDSPGDWPDTTELEWHTDVKFRS